MSGYGEPISRNKDFIFVLDDASSVVSIYKLYTLL